MQQNIFSSIYMEILDYRSKTHGRIKAHFQKTIREIKNIPSAHFCAIKHYRIQSTRQFLNWFITIVIFHIFLCPSLFLNAHNNAKSNLQIGIITNAWGTKSKFHRKSWINRHEQCNLFAVITVLSKGKAFSGRFVDRGRIFFPVCHFYKRCCTYSNLECVKLAG